VLGALRNRVESRRVPVVMLTAAADDEDVWRAWSGGVDYYLSKPFAPEELLRFLRYLLAGPDPMAVGPA